MSVFSHLLYSAEKKWRSLAISATLPYTGVSPILTRNLSLLFALLCVYLVKFHTGELVVEWLSGMSISFAQADKGCFMERYEKEKLFQRTKCISQAFITLPVPLLTGRGITLEQTSFHLLHLNRKDTPGNPQFSAIFQFCLLRSRKRFTI